jgi:hypothetical protein
MPLNESDLTSTGFGRAGIWTRLSLRNIARLGDVVYWSKNPSFSCFDGRVTGSANLKAPAGFSRIAGSAADFLNGTSAYLFFNADTLRSVIVQVMASYVWAHGFAEDFRKTATDAFGDGVCADLLQVPFKGPRSTFTRPLHHSCTWENGTTVLVSRIAPTGRSAHVHWSRK